YRGSDVRIAGVKVGQVKKIELDGTQPVATIAMNGKFAPLRTGAVAIPRTKSLLGEGYVEISPGPKTAPVLRAGQQLPASQVRKAQTLDQVLSMFAPRTRGDLRSLFTGMSQAFAGEGDAINNSIASSAQLWPSFTTVAQILDEQHSAVRTMIARSGEVLG